MKGEVRDPRPRRRRTAALLTLAALAAGAAGPLGAQEAEPAAAAPVLLGPSAAPVGPAPAPTVAPGEAGDPATPSRWTVASAAERALQQHPTVALARSQRDVARAELAAAEADRRPSLALAASAFRHQEPMVVTPIHGFSPSLVPEFDTTLLQGALQARYDLWDGGARDAQVAQRTAQLGAAESVLVAEGQQLVARTVGLYLRVLGLAGTLEAHRQRVIALAEEEERVKRLLDVGRAAEVDARRVEAVRAGAEADRVAVAAALDTAERDLARLLAVEAEAARAARLVPLPPEAVAAPPRPDLHTAALARSPAVERAREEVLAADAAVAAARAARRPTLRLEGNYLGFGDDDGTAQAEWNAGVRVGMPLLDGRTAAQIARAEAAAAAAGERLRLAELQVATELDRAVAAHAEATARAAALAEAEVRFAEVVRVERLRLEVGVGVQRDYLAAEADLLAARAARVEARHAAAAARAELARVAGELTPEWLRREMDGDELAPAPGPSEEGADGDAT